MTLDTPDLEAILAAYEAAQGRGEPIGPEQLARFAPSPDHPAYLSILCELVRVDLEFGWDRGQPFALSEYQRVFPRLFQVARHLGAIAFEEYRLRRRAGQNPSPAEYEALYRINTADWPQPLADASPPTNTQDRLPGREPVQPPPQPKLPEPGDYLFGFHLLADLGRGAFARVYLAEQTHLANRLVVLKVAPDIASESQALGQLTHPNIVPIYSVHRSGPWQALCMPYLGSMTLADLLRDLRGRDNLPHQGKAVVTQLFSHKSSVVGLRPSTAAGMDILSAESEVNVTTAAGETPVPLKTLQGLTYVQAILWIAARMADGLAYAHTRGILHRDLKPANVLLSEQGQPMLLDFNLSADLKRSTSTSSAATTVGGTLAYMAPEHLLALQSEEAPTVVDARSDLYSLGVILYELLTGRSPFPGHRGPLTEVLMAMIADRSGEPPPLRRWNKAVSPAVEAIVRQLLHPDPAWRYPSAEDLKEDLENQLNNQPLRHCREPSRLESGRKWLRRRPNMMPLAQLALALAIGFAYLVTMWPTGPGRQEAVSAHQALHDELRQAESALLSAGPDETEPLRRADLLCRQALGRYPVGEPSSWDVAQEVRHLSSAEQARLREEIGYGLLLLAATEATLADRTADSTPQHNLRAMALRANELAETYYPRDRTSRLIWQQRVELLRQLGQSAAAARLVRQAEGAPWRSSREIVLAAHRQRLQGWWRTAVTLVQEATRLNPGDFWACQELGQGSVLLEQDAQAVDQFRTALAVRPDSAATYAARGAALLRLRRVIEALHDFDVAIRLLEEGRDATPKHELAGALADRAVARQHLEQHREAERDLTRALELDSGRIRCYFLRATSRERLGDAAGAREDRATGLRLPPRNEDDWLARGNANFPGQPQAALAAFDEGLKQYPRSYRLRRAKADVLANHLDRAEQSVAVLTELLASYPDAASAQARRGLLLARLDRRDEAVRDAQTCFRSDPPLTVVFQVACIYAQTSRHDATDIQECLRLLQTALRDGINFDRVASDHDLDPVRELPEFRRLLDAARVLQGGKSNS